MVRCSYSIGSWLCNALNFIHASCHLRLRRGEYAARHGLPFIAPAPRRRRFQPRSSRRAWFTPVQQRWLLHRRVPDGSRCAPPARQLPRLAAASRTRERVARLIFTTSSKAPSASGISSIMVPKGRIHWVCSFLSTKYACPGTAYMQRRLQLLGPVFARTPSPTWCGPLFRITCPIQARHVGPSFALCVTERGSSSRAALFLISRRRPHKPSSKGPYI